MRPETKNAKQETIHMTKASPAFAVAEMIEELRATGTALLDPKKRGALGQFMTPAPIAQFMAGLFKLSPKIKLLDPGAGTGSLSTAFIHRALSRSKRQLTVDAWEIDPKLRDVLESAFEYHTKKHINITTSINAEDFIEASSFYASTGINEPYTHAILNPPYKKLATSSDHRKYLRSAGIETVNLYAGFTALAVKLLAYRGEMVAIIPRSFCNGPYYRPFRDILFDECAIKQIHLFESRTAAFKDDEVLQENIIIHVVKGAPQGPVKITISPGADFSDIQSEMYPFETIVRLDDTERFIRIPSNTDSDYLDPEICSDELPKLKAAVSTGPVVGFRLREHLRKDLDSESVPLLYQHHFSEGECIWPQEHKKPNAIVENDKTRKWLMPRGDYVLVKRFSSKEERRRIVAYHLKSSDIPSSKIGLDNKWNVFHFEKNGIDRDFAKGLCVFLNSTILDKHFRTFSGHTQVNATDLRIIKYPNREKLIRLGKKLDRIPTDQDLIDNLVEQI